MIDNKELAAVEAEISPAVSEAKELSIESLPDLLAAVGMVRTIKALRSEIDDTFKPHVKRAHDSHKALLATARQYTDPLDSAEAIVRDKIGAYTDEFPDTECQGLSFQGDVTVRVNAEQKSEIIKKVAKGHLPETALKVDTKTLKELVKAGLDVPCTAEEKTVLRIRG